MAAILTTVPQPTRRARSCPLENCDLLSERENFKGGVAATAEKHADCGQDCEDEFGHELTGVTWRNVVPSDRSGTLASH